MVSDLTLLEMIDATDFSPAAHDLFGILAGLDFHEEETAVVLIAAAVILARHQIESGLATEAESLGALGYQFLDVIAEARSRLNDGRCRPHLKVAGGTDFHPERTQA